jgi:adenosine deaminase
MWTWVRRAWLRWRKRARRVAAGLAVVIVLALLAAGAFVWVRWDGLVTAAKFHALRDDHTALRAFLRRMPKGADLHVHLSGAVFAERLIAWATQDGLCLQQSDLSIITCHAGDGIVPLAEAIRDQKAYDRLIDALSTRNFAPSAATPSGHDQFFYAFGKIGPVTGSHFVDLTIDQLRQYEKDSVQYVELMASFFSGEDRAPLVAAIANEGDLAAMLAILNRNGLQAVVESRSRKLAEVVEQIEAKRNCRDDPDAPGCKVHYRFIAQVSRNNPLKDVFVQTALAAALSRAIPQVVAGLNFVSAEDNRVALHDYAAHMRIVGFLAEQFGVQVSLHAGELWGGLVPSDDLRFHIRQAVEVAKAQRIGHAVDLAFEDDMEGLLATMRRNGIAVEINLTSNDKILGVRGRDHPLPTYLAAGVPVVLSTDDAGISRIDLTNEYFRAARDYGLDYDALRTIARASLAHAFLQSEKAAEQDRFEATSAAFEQAEALRQSTPRNLVLLAKYAVGWR